MDDPVIRRFGEGDSVEGLTDLLHRAYAEWAAEGIPFTAADQAPEVTRRRMEGRECWLATLDGRVAGTILLGLSVPPDVAGLLPPPPVGFLSQWAVDPPLRRRGIGRRLLDHAEERARALGCATVALGTAETATRLVRLYESRGYRVAGRIDRPGKPYRTVVLSRLLAAGDAAGGA